MIPDRPPIALLRSREGDENTDWPASPPLQDCQQLPSMPDAILGTGMAGSAHWSIALEQTKNGQADTEELVWDVAARLRKGPPIQPDHLGSEYEVGRSTEDGSVTVSASINEDGSLRIRCTVAGSEYDCSLFGMPTRGQTPVIELTQNEQGVQIAILTANSDSTQAAQTVRWKYGLRWESSSII